MAGLRIRFEIARSRRQTSCLYGEVIRDEAPRIVPPQVAADTSVDVTDARNATWVISAAVPTTSRLTTSQSLPSTSPPAGVTAAQKGVGEMPGAIWRTLPSTNAM